MATGKRPTCISKSLPRGGTSWTTTNAGGASAKHVAQTVAGVRRILDGCRFVFLADLFASRVQTILATLRDRPGPTVTLDATAVTS